jgi:hypothetical protein
MFLETGPLKSNFVVEVGETKYTEDKLEFKNQMNVESHEKRP